MNFGFLGRGNSLQARADLIDQLAGAASGLKIHEDWGADAGGRSIPACRSPTSSTFRSRSTPTR